MPENPQVQTAITQYIEQFLESQLGEKPDQVTVTLHPPFLLVHLSGFLLPSEKMFVERGDWNRVLETRDLIIASMKAELITGLEERSGRKVLDLYADWNLANKSGMLIATMEKTPLPEEFPWPEEVDQEAIRDIILMNSMHTQKKPDQTNFYWLSKKVLLVERIGILVEIEKQLVKNGIVEELRLAKRPLEHRITKLFNLESLLNGQVQELFVDWDFQQDNSYMVLLLEK
ncbi:Na-translocating system protein MpsC family protein [Planococcus sp. FY231025]|uniref:Na-translocating system protein MpsC family protein n=1 Tax=Planococcus sp. FY231025 TaxID=3455699 RepID=UPI003F8DBA37